MKLKEIEKELLLKGAEKDAKYILTHSGFVNNCEMTQRELKLLNELANRLNHKDMAIVIDNFVFSAYTSKYYQSIVLAGIKINKAMILK